MDTHRFDPRPISDAPAPPDPTTWVWHGYLARGNITLLTSRWKTGKTTLLAGLLRSLGPGQPFLARPSRPAAAVVVSEEAEAHWADRRRAIPVGPNARFICRPFLARPTPAQWDDFLGGARTVRRRDGLDLLVVDSLAEFLPGRSDSDPATVLDFLRPLRRLAEDGAAVLVLHHPRKHPAAEGDIARGSGALLAFVDVILELHPCGGLPSDAHRRRLIGRSRLPDTPRQLVYEWTPGTPDFRPVGDPSLERFRENWEAVRAIMEGRTRAATHKELLADWPPDRLPPSPSQLYEWLGRAASEGWVERIGEGTRKNPFRFRLPRPDTDTTGPQLPDLPDLPPIDFG